MVQAAEYIVIVDDDEGVRRMLDLFVRREGFEAESYHLPSEALRAAQAQHFDLAFVDINLPEMDGLELARRLRELLPDLTIVFITGFESLESAVGAIRLGAYDYIKKPFDQSELTFTLERYRLRRRLRRRAATAEKRHELLLQHVPVLIFLLRPDLELEYINDTCRPMLGFERSEAVGAGQWLMDRIHPDDRDKMRQLFLSALDRYAPFSAEFRILHKEGFVIHAIAKSIPRQGVGAPEADESGSEHLLECALMDITDRVLLEQRLVQDEKLKTLGAIAAEVAHEIRNPLVSIGGFARRLQRKAPDISEADIILREAGRLEQLLDRINNYLTPVNLRRELCQVNGVLADAVEFLSPRIDERGIWPELRLAEGLPEVYVDAEVLRQIFVNTILNALKTSRDAGVFTIRSLLRGDNVHVEFVTELPRNAEVDPDQLLAPFSEANEHIGLSLSLRLIKHMGGLLTVERDGPQATFRITLPRHDQAQPQQGVLADEDSCDFGADRKALKDPMDFHELLQTEWLRQAREVRPLSLALVNVDYFEAYRQRHGELAAGRLLENVGEALSERLRRPGDFVALYSDGCFAAVLPGVPAEGAAKVGWSLVEAVADLCAPSGVESGQRNVTACVGVATCVPQGDLCPEDLISDAAQALQKAKVRGAGQLTSSTFAPGA